MSAGTRDWERVKAVFHEALARAPGERAELVQRECGSNPDLIREVESLLAAHDQAGSFAEHPPRVAGSVLAPSSFFGRYKVLHKIGAGGMGEVYRARDTTLGREVALKVLPRELADDADRTARLEREARLLAALNHPHVATIHGFEESQGRRAIVMELVEGPTLRERLARGPLRWEEALRIAAQIADALAAAHDKGIVHRDLKPENVKLTPSGAVKVLDFGLAKPIATAGVAPSMTGAGPLTIGATLAGTPAYMSPEQARGAAVDSRSDIWAFGCVLYEMLTGRAAFDGATMVDVLAHVLERDPDWTLLPANTPEPSRRLLRRCLRKDPDSRIRDAHDMRLDVEDALRAVEVQRDARPSRRAFFGVGAFALGALGTSGIWALTASRPGSSGSVVASIVTTIPEEGGAFRGLAISPDGSQVVYEAGGMLHLRPIHQLASQPIRGTEGARWPAFSPDGASIAFFVPSESAIQKTSIAGMTTARVTTTDGGTPNGLTWTLDDTIVFATATSGGLWRVPAIGGEPEQLTRAASGGALSHVWPTALPNGRGVLFGAFRGGNSRVAVLSLDTGDVRDTGLFGNIPRYAPSGHLVYSEGGVLWAVEFNQRQLMVTGVRPAPVIEDALNFDLATTGTLLYEPGSTRTLRTLVWIDRDGREEPLPLPPRDYHTVRVSPGGDRIVTEFRDPGRASELWISEVSRPGLRRIATAAHIGGNFFPNWTPDGRGIVFTGYPVGAGPALFRTPANGPAAVEQLVTMPESSFIGARGWTPDGSLLFAYGSRTGAARMGVLRMDAAGGEQRQREAFPDESGSLFAGSVHDGWMVYERADDGAMFIQRFPGGENRQPVAADRGRNVIFSPDGRELFYRRSADGAMMAVPVGTRPRLILGVPRVVFSNVRETIAAERRWDVARSGRFLVLRDEPAPATATSRQLVLMQNWHEELNRLVPSS